MTDMAARYDIRQDDEGWTVYDIFTGLPALVQDVPQTGLDMEDADDLADLLSLAERKHRGLHRELTR
jgi:hypothetical protein